MKRIKVLSIDFDYFINASIGTRNDIFPDGADEVPKEEMQKLWEDMYREYPMTKFIDVIDEYNIVCNFLRHPKYRLTENVFMAESHKDIREVLECLPNPLDVYNIDFHHDMYTFYTGGDNYNCSTWARRLLEDRPDTKYTWIRRKDSDTRVLGGEVECEHTTRLHNLLSVLEVDYVFICMSPEWTPPHLEPLYKDMIECTNK